MEFACWSMRELRPDRGYLKSCQCDSSIPQMTCELQSCETLHEKHGAATTRAAPESWRARVRLNGVRRAGMLDPR